MGGNHDTFLPTLVAINRHYKYLIVLDNGEYWLLMTINPPLLITLPPHDPRKKTSPGNIIGF